MVKLTLKKLKDMKLDSIFASGVVMDNADGINMSNSNRILRWVAKRRGGEYNWCIYIHTVEHSDEYIRAFGFSNQRD